VFGTWGGDAAEAARAATTQTSRDLELDANEAAAVAAAANRAAADIESVHRKLRNVQQVVASAGMAIDPVTNRVAPAPGSSMPKHEAALKFLEFQPEVDAIVAEANAVDDELAQAINLAAGRTSTTAPSGPGVAGEEVPQFDTPAGVRPGTGYWTVDRSESYSAPVQGVWSPENHPMTPSRPGPSSGMTDFARTWQEDAQAPIVHMQRAYQFRIAGTEWDGATYRWVQEGGKWHMAKWMSYQYQMQVTDRWVPSEEVEAVAGLPALPLFKDWEPVSMSDLARITDANPTATLYLPDGCGGAVPIAQNVPHPNPGVPIMTRPR
jgi:hypothetical protein